MPSKSPILTPVPDEILGDRVLVRPYQPEDAPALWDAIEESREHLAPWMPWVEYYLTPDQAVEFVVRARAQWSLRQDLIVGVFERSTGRFLGGSGLHRIDWDLRAFEIGYWLRRSAEGRGYMRETVQALTRTAFESLDANRVEIRMNSENVRSRNVAERLGFVYEGTLRNAVTNADGAPRDGCVYSLIPEDFAALGWR